MTMIKVGHGRLYHRISITFAYDLLSFLPLENLVIWQSMGQSIQEGTK